MPPPVVPRRRTSGESLLFGSLLILHLAPIWLLPFIPTQDGPGHQALAFILRHYDRPEAGILREYYLPNREALPNWFFFFLMSKVLGFVSVPMAEKILLTAYVLLLPLSVRYALRTIDPRAGFLAALSFPFLYNFLFQMGFFNFCFSLAAFFFTLGYWLRSPERMTPVRTAGLALLILWVYLCHPVTLVVTVAALLTLAGWRTLLAFRREGLVPSFRKWLFGPILASLPALLLTAVFVGRRTGAAILFPPLWGKVIHLAALHSLASVDRWTVPLAVVFAFLFYAVAVSCLRARGRRPPEAGDGLLLVLGVLLVAYFTAPSDLAGGGLIDHRLNLFPFLVLILWFGTFEYPAVQRRRIQAAATGTALAFLGLFVWKWIEIDDCLDEVLAAGRWIEPDHTVLFLSYAHQGETPAGGKLVFRSSPFVHAGGYLAARKRLVDLSLYEANENYFPIYFEPRRSPYAHLASARLGIELQPPRVDLLGYPGRTGGRVDYVLLWGLRDGRRSEPAVREVLRQLAAAYEPVHVSPGGRVRLFRLRPVFNLERRGA
ncbi:MAG TPA: hypothetical protein VHC97_12385 [Thermoanaerobaculia bacterium]|nr:hypothetical protein [Thermoanaerobaculia bacterium]